MGLHRSGRRTAGALGFFADGKLKTIELSGGPAIVVADAAANGGGSWNREGTLLFVPDNSQRPVPSGGLRRYPGPRP